MIITASFIPTHPSVHIIKTTIDSLKYLHYKEKIIVFLAHDIPKGYDLEKGDIIPERYQLYFDNLNAYIEEYNKKSKKFELRFIKRSTYGHLTGNIRHCMQYIESEFLFIVQHDLAFCKKINLDLIVKDMKKKNKLKYIRFNLRKNEKVVSDKDKINFFNNHNIKTKNNNYISTLSWSDNNHLTTTKYYDEIILLLCENGKAMEKTLMQYRHKNDTSMHSALGTYIYGELNESKYVYHLDGRKTKK